jgi:D-glycero-alpha-D-manno-heptose-7-phosphate kinase
VIITRTPLRISLGGGGSDLPSYYRRHGGMVIAAAINKYIYIAINSTFTNDYFIKYSEHERVPDVAHIRHPIVREALRRHPSGPVEIVSVADVPAGTGLGSSGSFTVGLLRALYAFRREHVTAGELAEEACDIEITQLNRPVGKQDQYIGAYGGLTCFEFLADGRVHVRPLQIPRETLRDLEERLLLFFTGYSRSADDLLADQRTRSEQGDAAMLSNLDAVVRIGYRVREALEGGNAAAFADLMHEHWEAKKVRLASASGAQNEAIARWYDIGRAHGARGGKLVGAGGGGFLMFYADDPASLRRSMAEQGLREVPFHFDHDGTTLTARDS